MENWFKIAVIGRSPKWTLARAAVLAGLCLFTANFILLPAKVVSDSMEPAFREGSIRVINLAYYRFHPVERGDVVAIRIAGRRVLLLKRIVGLPGERISFRAGKLLVNGEEMNEPYVRSGCDWEREEVELEEGEYFVVGDNRGMPMENHMHGRVKGDRIVGRAWW